MPAFTLVIDPAARLRYAALLRLDSRRFPALYRRARPHLL